ncbi:MAG: hypothetical protein ABSA42_06500 [Terracidiphilus sp.]|jgi:uncharacterized membrane protein HdeD (DUF308 family)
MAPQIALQDWIFVAFGAAVALTGGWIQLHPEGILPGEDEDWQLETGGLTQIRRLGACFLFMGAFFAVQMSFDLTRRPWWSGTLSGLATALAGVALVHAQSRRRRRAVRRLPLSEKAIKVQ